MAAPDSAIGLPAGVRWTVRMNTDWRGYSDAFGTHALVTIDAIAEPRDGLPATATLTLPPYSVLILSQDH